MKKIVKVVKKKEEIPVIPNTSKHKYSSLHDVVDRKRLFKMIYSGVESEDNFDILYDLGIRDFLMSFHYIQKKRQSMKRYAELGVKFFIDSGAYTFINNEEFHSYTIEQWEAYIESYLKWAKKNTEVLFAIANLDIEFLVGQEQVELWNKKYFEPFMLETGILVCFIWHSSSGEKQWEYYTQRYPYTGFSWATESGDSLTLDYGKRMLDVAKKNNSVCHGMGMTRTSILTKLPFYTSDSTTYLVGVQYGEINWWTGSKMTRLKKDKWKKPDMLKKFEDMGLSVERLEEEKPNEMTKANAMAFMLAQEYIDTKLAPRMYWLMPEVSKNSLEDLSSLPSAEFISSKDINNLSLQELQKVAKPLNINFESEDANWICNCIIDLTAFLNWDNPEYKDVVAYYTEEVLDEIHEQYVNKIRASSEEKIDDLKLFFQEVFTGENKKLLHYGTNFDVTAKERMEYIEEKTSEDIDVSLDEYMQAIQNTGLDMLSIASPTEEDEALERLDAEIFDKTGMLTVRDEKGKFIKGQKRVKRPKNLYSDKYPKLACNTCYSAQTCPEFKEGYVCAYHKMFKRFDTRNLSDVLEGMQSIANMSLERVQKAMLFEQLDGGRPNNDTSNLMNQAMQMMNNLNSIYENGGVILKHTKRVNSDGSIEETTSMNQNSNETGGVIEKLFSMAMGKDIPEEPKQEVIEAEFQEVEEEKSSDFDRNN